MASFESAQPELKAEGIFTIAASTDPVEKAAETVGGLGLSFPVGHTMALFDLAERFGCYYERRRGILHATGFVVQPGGTIATLHYSAGPIGRLVTDDVLSLVRFWKRGQ